MVTATLIEDAEPSREPAVALAQAEALVAIGMNAEAIPILQEALDAGSADERVRARLAAALWNDGRETQALDVLDKGRPDSPLNHWARAWILTCAGALERARNAAETAVQLAPMEPGPADLLAALAFLTGRQEQALRTAERLIELDPESARGHELVGHIALKSGDWDRAREQYERTITIDPDAYPARTGLGVALHRLGKPSEAMTNLHLAAQADPDDSFAREQLVTVALRQLLVAPLLIWIVLSWAIAITVGTLVAGSAVGAVSLIAATAALVGLIVWHRRRRQQVPSEVLVPFKRGGPLFRPHLKENAMEMAKWIPFAILVGYTAFIATEPSRSGRAIQQIAWTAAVATVLAIVMLRRWRQPGEVAIPPVMVLDP